MNTEAPEMVTIPRAGLDTLAAAMRGLQRQAGGTAPSRPVPADPGPGRDGPAFPRDDRTPAPGAGD